METNYDNYHMKKVRNAAGFGITSIMCANMPESLCDANNAKKHFSKFGRVTKITLKPKRQMCTIDYEEVAAAEKALLNAGAYDGFMFDVTRSKKIHKASKKDDDPDWVPDSDVEDELSAMGATATYRVRRQKPMEIDKPPPLFTRTIKQAPMKVFKSLKNVKQLPKKEVYKEKKIGGPKVTSVIESPVVAISSSSSLNTVEAAAELNQLRSRVSLTPDEQWRTLDARDRILRAWGGTGARVKLGGATIGTCTDMCPEKERLHRQAEHQVMTLEAVPGSDGNMLPSRAVKQYSRSSADQEMPMSYELRPASVLRMTSSYLLHEIADVTSQVSLADWFHFMWDRFRGIRKDITQQALCCAESISLLEMCARFHAHCAARLADLEHTQFDQKLNTDNLTKCLQTLKHMYADASPEQKPHEPEFRGYIALLNLGDSNFWWEIKQLPQEIQKSKDIAFAIEVFNAIDNNNYVRFFRLIKERATYLQACILMRYFNDVRARALARIVKAFAPKSSSRYPAEDLLNFLAFESVDSMKSFVNHYGLHLETMDDNIELSIRLDRNQFIEDSDPYPMSRAISLIEVKRQCTVGKIIAGGTLPEKEYNNHKLYSSFNQNGTLRDAALLSEDQGYNTKNDTNKNIEHLKAELSKFSQGGRNLNPINIFSKPEPVTIQPSSIKTMLKTNHINHSEEHKTFSFKPAINVAANKIVKPSLDAHQPENVFKKFVKNRFLFNKPKIIPGTTNEMIKLLPDIGRDGKSIFSFSKPQDTSKIKLWTTQSSEPSERKLMSKIYENNENEDPTQIANSTQNIFVREKVGNTNIVHETDGSNLFTNLNAENKIEPVNIFNDANKISNKIFSNNSNKNVFGKSKLVEPKNIFSINNDKTGNIFAKMPPDPAGNVFTKSLNDVINQKGSNVFSTHNSTDICENGLNVPPSDLFKNAINSQESQKVYSIFQSKNNPPQNSVAANIFNSANTVYDFNSKDEELSQEDPVLEDSQKVELEHQQKQKEEERMLQELMKREEKKVEEAFKQEELRKLEEIRKLEEQQHLEECKRKLEEDMKQMEMKRKIEEEKRFQKLVELESTEVVDEIICEVNSETVTCFVTEEINKLKQLLAYADFENDEIVFELCNEICRSEIEAAAYYRRKLMKKWFHKWRKQSYVNLKRRKLLDNTPVWLSEYPIDQEVQFLKRPVQRSALTTMNAFHRGQRFTGEGQSHPAPEPYRIVDIIRSRFLKRMRQIHYPYDKCFFWKFAVISPGATKWINKKIEIEPWIQASFTDNKCHHTHATLIHVNKYSWNNLMDFAISVSLLNEVRMNKYREGIEGCNALLFYTSEDDNGLLHRIQYTLNQKYPNHILPIAIIMPFNLVIQSSVEQLLNHFLTNKIISCYKLFILDQGNTYDCLNYLTKHALKWLAKNYPPNPPLEIDLLKSFCQRYLGNELWYRLRLERHTRMNTMLKNLPQLITCYNMAVDKLIGILTNQNLLNYPSFPLEFKTYLDKDASYPKPYEFIPNNVKNSKYLETVKLIMNQLKLPRPTTTFLPINAANMQHQIRTYCNQIRWFENSEEVFCKFVSLLPNEFNQEELSCEQFNQYFQNYDWIDLLNVLVYEKISKLKNFGNRLAIYEKATLQEYSKARWWIESSLIRNLKHKAIDFGKDEIDFAIAAKRRKLSEKTIERLTLKESDATLVKKSIKEAEEKICKYNYCAEAVQQLEEQVEQERRKSLDLENLLKAALADG